MPLRDRLASVAGALRGRGVWLVSTLLVLVVAIHFAYQAGSRHWSQSMLRFRAEHLELVKARDELADLRQTLVNREIAARIDAGTIEQLRQQVLELRTQISRQEGELAFYRNLMAEDDEVAGLEVDSLTLRPGSEPTSYQYRILVRRKSTGVEPVDVWVSLNIEGNRDGQVVSLPFNEADLSRQRDSLTIRFKYFKVLRGTFLLPEGFEPKRVVLSIIEKNDPSSLRIADFPWRVEEM
ncbi:MAG: hypothetical protein CMK32_15610 [Porticoccaceae bacterium]|nr:hypothetical protein [Porticoccaceae bacterium]